MTKILIDEAVVRQALEYLNLQKMYGPAMGFGNTTVDDPITDLRQALANAALDKMADNARELGLSYEQPAPAQEPFCYHDGRNIVGEEYASHCDVFPLYTIPPAPAKPWVGLTHDERKKLADVIRFNNIWYLEDMLRAAEEMLERKNT